MSSFQSGSLLIVQPTDKTLEVSNKQELVVESWLAALKGRMSTNLHFLLLTSM